MRNFRGTTLLSLLVDGGIASERVVGLVHADVTTQLYFFSKYFCLFCCSVPFSSNGRSLHPGQSKRTFELKNKAYRTFDGLIEAHFRALRVWKDQTKRKFSEHRSGDKLH